MHLAVQIAWSIVWLTLLCGLVLIHVRLRNIPSLSLLLSAAFIAAWMFFDGTIVDFFASHPETIISSGVGTNAKLAMDAMAAYELTQNVHAICESLLGLWFALSFLLVAGSVRARHAA